MIGAAPAGAVDMAPPQLGVERIEHLGVQRAGLEPPDERVDVLLQHFAYIRRVVRPISSEDRVSGHAGGQC
jgi:hypothetical protein